MAAAPQTAIAPASLEAATAPAPSAMAAMLNKTGDSLHVPHPTTTPSEVATVVEAAASETATVLLAVPTIAALQHAATVVTVSAEAAISVADTGKRLQKKNTCPDKTIIELES